MPLNRDRAYEAENVSTYTTPRSVKRRRWIRLNKIGPAFWTLISISSLLINVVLIVVLLSIGKQLFAVKALMEKQALGGLYTNFAQMDEAHIRTTIPINTEVPAKFDLPLNTNTTVTLTEDTVITNATVYEFNAGGALYIPRANTHIILPAGSKMPVALNLTVPVDQKIPVKFNVAVDIPLQSTELHQPFVGLQNVVQPYYTYLGGLPDSWQEVICGKKPSNLCQKLVP